MTGNQEYPHVIKGVGDYVRNELQRRAEQKTNISQIQQAKEQSQIPPALERIASLRKQFNQEPEEESIGSFYQAILENQDVYRQRREGREMPKLSEKIETQTKRIFAPYIDQEFPRVLISWNVIADLPEERMPYHRYETGGRFPEGIAEHDRRRYSRGLYALNEWATNYATVYYLENENSSPLPRHLRAIYAKMLNYGSTISGMNPLENIQTYRIMERVHQTALATNVNFSQAVFQALFQHDFNQLNTLIANTKDLQANNVDELALRVSKKGGKLLEKVIRNPALAHLLPSIKSSENVNTRSKGIEKSIENAITKVTHTLIYAGYFGQPGIARIMLPSHISTGFVGAKYVAVHECMHAYSASPDFVGLIPKKLIQRDPTAT